MLEIHTPYQLPSTADPDLTW